MPVIPLLEQLESIGAERLSDREGKSFAGRASQPRTSALIPTSRARVALPHERSGCSECCAAHEAELALTPTVSICGCAQNQPASSTRRRLGSPWLASTRSPGNEFQLYLSLVYSPMVDQTSLHRRVGHSVPGSRDIVDVATRSKMMRAVRQRGTRPERAVRAIVTGLGFKYRLNARGLPGSPDLSNLRAGWALFVHGCFWHGHRNCQKTKGGRGGRIPLTNQAYWSKKMDDNRRRDQRQARQLRAMGLRVRTIWECELKDPERVSRKLAKFLRED